MIYIILVNYNSYRDTIECVKTIEKSNYNDYQVIVVDNGSKKEIVQSLKAGLNERHILLESQSNLGFSGGNNIGIRYALERDAEYILLLNNDTLIEPNLLENLVNVSLKYGNQAVISPMICYEENRSMLWYAGGEIDYHLARISHTGYQMDATLEKYQVEKEVSFISGCCMLIPVEIIKKTGLLAEEYFLYHEDVDYSCRLRQQKVQMIYTPTTRIYHKVSASTGKKSFLSVYYATRNRNYIIEKYVFKKDKWLAYAYHMLLCIKRLLKKDYQMKAVYRGWLDYFKNITGRLK